MNEITEPIRPKNPRENANIFSIVTFFYTLPTFWLGYKKDLEEKDIYEVVSEYKSLDLGDKVEKEWLKELERCKSYEKKPSLWKVFFKCFGIEYMTLGLGLGLVEVFLKTYQILSLGEVITFFMNNNNNNRNEVYISATKLIVSSFLVAPIYQIVTNAGYLLGLKIRTTCSFLVYRKSLRLSKTAFSKITSGQFLNIISNDIKGFEKCVVATQHACLGCIQTVIFTYFLYKEVGYTVFFGISFLLLFIPLQIFFGKLFFMYRLKSAARTDERIRLMNEIILGISIIKMYTWEKLFSELVATFRKIEMKGIKVATYLKIINSSFNIVTTRGAVCITLVAQVLIHNNLNARQVFIMIGFYNLLRPSMVVYFPQSISLIAELNVCVGRLSKFLLLEDVERQSFQNVIEKKSTIILENLSAKWSGTTAENTLTEISLNINPKSLIAVIGPVGSGKTSLLYSILNELPVSKGTINVQGKISYASQEPWLFPESVQQNILFGSKFDPQRYKDVVKACALETDFQLLPYADNTEIGERGGTLSGGQRSRVNLARAVYRDADIYLLDDPLSAVDTHVGKEIFNKCIKSFLSEKTVVLVTHQLQYLKEVDYIVILNNGVVITQGTPAQLENTGIDFVKFLNQEFISSDESSLEKKDGDIITNQSSVSSKLQEEKRSGALSKRVYLSYIKSGASCRFTLFTIVLFVLSQVFVSSIDYFLAYWVNWEQSLNGKEESFRKIYLTIYVSLIVALFATALGRSVAFTQLCTNASINLHDCMFNSIVTATIRFFNTNPSGRILNRFSKDMGLIDEELPYCAIDTVTIGLVSIGIVIVISIVNYWLLLPAILIILIVRFLRLFYISTSRSLKRLDGVTRSPVMSHLNYSLQGLTTIRAFEMQETMENKFSNHLDLNTSVGCLFFCTSKAFGYWLDLVSVIYIMIVTISCFFIVDENSSGNVGLVISQTLVLTCFLQWGVRQLSETENQMTAVERVLEYQNVEHEPLFKNPKRKPNELWPEHGEIKFVDLSLRYFLDEPPILKNLNFTIKSLEKVGIVGRTGAGKSSLISAIFRLTDTQGSILIDQIDTKTLGLHDLRSKISIIPQEPILFSGTMRTNLDPFGEFTDDEIWKVLEEVELKDAVFNLMSGLNSVIIEGGSNLSVGQRQLVCLARAMLRKNKILIMDEATANVDSATDMLIQKTIKRKFDNCTVLTVAHRLDTVMDSDRILVMDAGEVVEFDQPYVLLQNQKSVLYGMVCQTGSTNTQRLLNIAKNAYEKQQYLH